MNTLDPLSPNMRIYYLYDLQAYHRLGRHRPYYEIIRSTVEDVLIFNPEFHPEFRESLEELIANSIRQHLHLANYIHDRLHLIAEMERIIFRILTYGIKFDKYIIVGSDVRLEGEILIVGITKWI